VKRARRAAERRGRRLRIMFADEARFGRMNRPRPCWAPAGILASETWATGPRFCIHKSELPSPAWWYLIVVVDCSSAAIPIPVFVNPVFRRALQLSIAEIDFVAFEPRTIGQ
jgi:hypothetical protein